MHEIKLRHNAEKELHKQHKFLQAVINGVKDGLMVIDTNYEVKLSNNAFKEFSEINVESVLNNTHCYELSHRHSKPCDGCDHPCPLKIVIETGKHTSVLHNHKTKTGEDRFFDLLASPLFDDDGKITGIIEVSRDLTSHINLQNELKKKQQHFDRLAHHDTLTSLPNRLLFTDRLEQAKKHSDRTKKPFALMFIDLDQFKQINDSDGHNIGDLVLIEISKNIKECIRAEDTVARIGGDEFTIILSSFHNTDAIIEMAQKINNTVQKPLLIDSNSYHLTASIGISVYPNDTNSIDELVRNADTAMFKVKDKGRNSFQFYTEELTQQAKKRVSLENGMHKALNEKSFVVWYQPQYEIETGLLIGMEALVRWIDPKRGIIPPNDFIPLAEESGLIIELGKQIIDQVTKQVVAWRKNNFNPGNVSINLSGKQLLNKDIITDIKQFLEKNNCKIEWIDFEITESFILNDNKKTIKRLNDLKEMGFNIALDDFGTGYSSLSHLKYLPISKLKIDQSFIRDIPSDRDDVGISRAVIALAYGLDLEVIAEGVETKEQADFLLKEGCPLAQGYFYSKPVPADEITKILENNLKI